MNTGCFCIISAAPGQPPGRISRQLITTAHTSLVVPHGEEFADHLAIGVDAARHGRISLLIETDNPDAWAEPLPDRPAPTSTIEAVAAAAYTANWRPPSPPWSQVSPGVRAWFRRIAEAAIAAVAAP